MPSEGSDTLEGGQPLPPSPPEDAAGDDSIRVLALVDEIDAIEREVGKLRHDLAGLRTVAFAYLGGLAIAGSFAWHWTTVLTIAGLGVTGTFAIVLRDRRRIRALEARRDVLIASGSVVEPPPLEDEDPVA